MFGHLGVKHYFGAGCESDTELGLVEKHSNPGYVLGNEFGKYWLTQIQNKGQTSVHNVS